MSFKKEKKEGKGKAIKKAKELTKKTTRKEIIKPKLIYTKNHSFVWNNKKYITETRNGITGFGEYDAKGKEISFGKQKIAISENEFYVPLIPKKQKKIMVDGDNEVLVHLAKSERAEATELMVEKITKNNIFYTLRDDDKPEIWMYKEGIYVPQGVTYIQEEVRQIIGKAFTSQLVNDVTRKIMADTFIEPKEFFQEKKENINFIPVQNGILNLKTKELTDFTSEIIFFSKLPVTYEKNAICPAINKFLEDVLGNKEDAAVFLEWVGYCLLRDYCYEKALMCIGNGRNGKGKALALIERLVGKENTSSIRLQTLEKDQYSIGELFGKLANIGNDLPATGLKDVGTIKSLCGRDTQTANRKYKTHLSFINYAKLLFSCNTLPRVPNIDDDAWWMRWMVLEFKNQYLPEKELKAHKGKENNIFLQDPNIIDKISTPEELSGLLNEALEGLARLRKNKDFSYSPTTKKVRDLWIRQADSFAAFCMDNIESNYESHITKGDLKKRYGEYCREHKVKPEGDPHIKDHLTTQYQAWDERSSNEERKYVWKGVKLKTKDENVQDVQDVYTFQNSLRTSNSKTISKPMDKVDIMDRNTEVWDPCEHGNYPDENCLYCEKESKSVFSSMPDTLDIDEVQS